MFLVFVAVAAIFWFIIALNDNITETFSVRLNIQNVPDSVTFITDPPADIHVTLRDKGTNIMRSGVIKNPELNINFRDYARDGIFRLSSSDLNAELKSDLGGVAQITSCSIDSLRLSYSTEPGKKVPIIVRAEVSPASGYVISGNPVSIQKFVRIYSYGDEVDTIHTVTTQRFVRKNLAQTTVCQIRLVPIKNVKIVPDVVDVRINVEPLVHKEAYVSLDVLNVPSGESLLLFPNRVPVSFYVPMSRFNDDKVPVSVYVDYNDINRSGSSRIPVKLGKYPPILVNVTVKTDSVEYTLVK